VRFLIPYIEPLGLTWIGLSVSLALLIRMRRWKTGVAVALVWFIFTLCTCTSLPRHMLWRLEKPWLDTDLKSLPRADVIVSLGGAGEASKRELAGLHFMMGTDRLMTSVELMRQGKGGALVIGGGGAHIEGELLSEADSATAWIRHWHLVEAPVISLGVCMNTRDEAMKVSVLASQKGWNTIMLVTSANHMRRAEAVFKAAGLKVICAPCNYLAPQSRGRAVSLIHAPDARELDAFNLWLHELAGWWAYRWRGWVE
jgi:uncharacterized SAM-binding protein YcdF (DUF218 family)